MIKKIRVVKKTRLNQNWKDRIEKAEKKNIKKKFKNE